MDYFYAIILGVVEGITEFLPISSTGHLVLVGNLLNLPISEFWKSFEIAIQLGAILAVVVIYWKKVWDIKNVWPKIFTAFVPTALIGLALYKTIKPHLLGSSMVVLTALLVGGAFIILFEKYFANKFKVEIENKEIGQISYGKAALIGLFQSLAIVPGVSRSAATVIGGLMLGLSRQTIVEFSFLLAIPTMAAATGLDLLKNGFDFNGQQWGVLAVGFIVSFLTAFVAVKWLLKYIQTHSFEIFGWYRIVLALVWLVIALNY